MVIHYTAMHSAEAACATLSNPATEVSAHYLISEGGTVTCLVPEALRAWHAGAGCWGAVVDVNSRSIGIELANPGDRPFDVAQMLALRLLLRGIMGRWGIPPERVIGHSDMAPGRKIDPGGYFDWQGLARDGLSVWPQPRRLSRPDGLAALFRDAARAFGYTADVADDVVLAAVRLRFRPDAVGPLAVEDVAVVADLAARFPVDRAGGVA